MYSEGTKNYDLPTWKANEHPDFITDMSNAFRTIDEAMFANKEKSDETADVVAQQGPILEKNTNDITEMQHTVADLKIDVVLANATAKEAKESAEDASATAEETKLVVGGAFSSKDTVSAWKELLERILLPVTEGNTMADILAKIGIAGERYNTAINANSEAISEIEGTLSGYSSVNTVQAAIEQVMAKALEAINLSTVVPFWDATATDGSGDIVRIYIYGNTIVLRALTRQSITTGSNARDYGSDGIDFLKRYVDTSSISSPLIPVDCLTTGLAYTNCIYGRMYVFEASIRTYAYSNRSTTMAGDDIVAIAYCKRKVV